MRALATRLNTTRSIFSASMARVSGAAGVRGGAHFGRDPGRYGSWHRLERHPKDHRRRGAVGAGRTRREDKVVVEPGAYHSLLSTVPGYDGLAVVSIDYGRLRVQHHRGSGSLSVEHLFHVIRREVHLVALYLYELLQAQLEFFYVLFLPLKQYVAAAGHGLQMRKMAAQRLEVAVCRPINAYRVDFCQRNRSLHSANIENYRSICTE